MFLIASLLVLTLAYGLCALLSELLLRSPHERALPAAVRVAVGLMISVTYFAAAWLLMSIRQAWALGMGLVLVYGATLIVRSPIDAAIARIRDVAKAHARSYAACVAGGVLFFAPLVLGWNFGPFTEGGGDVSIYADLARYLANRGLTAKGSPSATVADAATNLRRAVQFAGDREILNKLTDERSAAADRSKIDPPDADYASYRVLVFQSMSPLLFVPYGEFDFLARSTNYPVYYGLQAFIYALLLACVWHAFPRWSREARLALLALVGASHGVISIYYNMYALHGLATLVCATVLALVMHVRPISLAGLRTYGASLAYLLVSYVHYLGVIAPLCGAALFNRRELPSPPPSADSRPGDGVRRVARLAAVALAAALVALLLYGGMQTSFMLVHDLVAQWKTGEHNAYFGDRLSIWSPQWLGFLFGLISQQHLPPFAGASYWILGAVVVGIAFGLASLVLGFVVMFMIRRSRKRSGLPGWDFEMILYVVLLVTLAGNLYVSQFSMYTQAKGAQNVLIVLYAALVLPFAAGMAPLQGDAAVRKRTIALGIALALFATTLLVVRAGYTWRVASQADRAVILESSFFSEAGAIMRQDPRAFVLFEPRKSGDLYLSAQPFSGARMVPTRHLALTKLDFSTHPVEGRRMIAADFISKDELPHLWWLSAAKEPGFLRPTYRWKAGRIAAHAAPTFYLLADDYERSYGTRPQSAAAAEKDVFSYVRNGAVLAYLPPGKEAVAEARLVARDADNDVAIAREVRERLAKGEFGSTTRIRIEGRLIVLSATLPPAGEPRLQPIARFSGEYFVNVRVDGAELR